MSLLFEQTVREWDAMERVFRFPQAVGQLRGTHT
jgi:hypothetical protein